MQTYIECFNSLNDLNNLNVISNARPTTNAFKQIGNGSNSVRGRYDGHYADVIMLKDNFGRLQI